MPTLQLDVRGFKNAYLQLNGMRLSNISRLKCIKFATTVGNSHFSRAFGKSQAALALAAYRATAVRCVIDFSHASLRPIHQYTRLESTEKMNLSYWIGMTFAAIAADEVLGVPRTIHAFHMGRRIRRANPNSKSLADLVGQDASNAWHVFEAKGRQTSPSQQNMIDWKKQATTVHSVNNTRVATGSYCVGIIANPFRVELIDPPPRGSSPVDLTVKPDDLGRGYYQAYIEFLQADPRKMRRDNRAFIVRPIAYDPVEGEFIYVGLEDRYFFLSDSQTQFTFSVDEYEDKSLYVGTDGVAIATSPGPCDL